MNNSALKITLSQICDLEPFSSESAMNHCVRYIKIRFHIQINQAICYTNKFLSISNEIIKSISTIIGQHFTAEIINITKEQT